MKITRVIDLINEGKIKDIDEQYHNYPARVLEDNVIAIYTSEEAFLDDPDGLKAKKMHTVEVVHKMTSVPKFPVMKDLTGWAKEQDRRAKKFQRDQIKNMSRWHNHHK